MIFLVEIDDETGYPRRVVTPGEERMSLKARTTWDALRWRYKAIQRVLTEQQREKEARQTRRLLDETPEPVTQLLRRVV